MGKGFDTAIVRHLVYFGLLAGCVATPIPEAARPPMRATPLVATASTTTVAPPVTTLAPPVTTGRPFDSVLLPKGHRIRFVTDGGEPSLARNADERLRAFSAGGHAADATGDTRDTPLHGAALEVAFGASIVSKALFAAATVPLAEGALARIVLLFARGTKEWFSVIEATPEMAHIPGEATSPSPWKVRLVERDGGAIKVLSSYDSYAHAARRALTRYERDGEAAVVPLGASVYAVTRAQVTVLEGPGTDRGLFEERPDSDCPPDKRCFMRPAEISLKSFLGLAPDGRSFVVAKEGRIERFSTKPGKVAPGPIFGYQNIFLGGLVEDGAIVLAHAGEPPFVARWSPPGRPPKSAPPGPPPLPASKQSPAGARPAPRSVTPATRDTIAEGRAYLRLAKTNDGALFGVTAEGALDRLEAGKATPVVVPAGGARVVSVIGGASMAFVLASDAPRPTYAIVTAE